MSQQHRKWIALVEQRLKEKNWSKADLTQAVGLRSQGTITDLLKTGKGSPDFVSLGNILKRRKIDT